MWCALYGGECFKALVVLGKCYNESTELLESCAALHRHILHHLEMNFLEATHS